jgi:iron complex outermembrane receptor protein
LLNTFRRSEGRNVAIRAICSAAVLLISLAAATPASSADAPSSIDIGELIIYADPVSAEDELRSSPTSITVIPRESFDKRFSTAPELLQETAGIEIRSYGGLGSFSTVSVRGSESSHVLVMVDGVALNQAVGGAVDMGAVPLANVERIEIYRGGVPARFQGTSCAGAVNIVTRPGAGDASVEASVGLGSFDSRSFHAFARMPVRSARASVDFSRMSSQGDFKFFDDNGTPLNADDDEWTPRVNNDFAADNLALKLDIFPGASEGGSRRVSISNQSYFKEQGIPGLGNFQSELARLKTFRNIFAATLEDKGALIPGAVSTIRLSTSANTTRFFDPSDQIGLGSQDNRNSTRSDSLFSAFEFFPADNHAVTAALSLSRETFKPYDARQVNQTGKPSRRNAITAAVEDSASFLGDKLLIVPSFRMERVSDRFSGDDPFDFSALAPETSRSDTMSAFSAGARYRVSGSFRLKANAGSRFRSPSFYELFGDRGSVIGNTELLPEKGKTSDIGFSWSVDGGTRSAHFEASYFRNYTDNLIVFMQNSQRVARADNIGRAKIRGFELILSAALSPSWSLSANHTYQNARDYSDVAFWRGNMLPGRREREFNSRLTFERAPWKAWHQFSRAGAGFHDRANIQPFPSGDIHSVGASFARSNSTFTIEGKNLTDNRVSDYIGFPLPGKAFFFTYQRLFK